MERIMINTNDHVCENCMLKKEIVIPEVDTEDVAEYEEIQIGLSIAQSTNKPENIPKNASANVIKAYFEVVMEREAFYKKREREWWSKILKKYKISDRTKIDTINKTFYHCIDDKGNEVIDFIPKTVSKNKVTVHGPIAQSYKTW
jgi:hypothetical protein